MPDMRFSGCGCILSYGSSQVSRSRSLSHNLGCLSRLAGAKIALPARGSLTSFRDGPGRPSDARNDPRFDSPEGAGPENHGPAHFAVHDGHHHAPHAGSPHFRRGAGPGHRHQSRPGLQGPQAGELRLLRVPGPDQHHHPGHRHPRLLHHPQRGPDHLGAQGLRGLQEPAPSTWRTSGSTACSPAPWPSPWPWRRTCLSPRRPSSRDCSTTWAAWSSPSASPPSSRR